MIYSHTIVRCTTIDVTAFHFCVRNGNRWFYSTMAAGHIQFKIRKLSFTSFFSQVLTKIASRMPSGAVWSRLSEH